MNYLANDKPSTITIPVAHKYIFEEKTQV